MAITNKEEGVWGIDQVYNKINQGSIWNYDAPSGINALFSWGYTRYGQLGQNKGHDQDVSSPTQIPGTTWSKASSGKDESAAIKTDGTLWAWGSNTYGQLGQNNKTQYSSPVQIPGTTWKNVTAGYYHTFATKTDGTLWAWGDNTYGALGQNQPDNAHVSSPIQIPGTTWDIVDSLTDKGGIALKTDGTLWSWGYNYHGSLGQNQSYPSFASSSSPAQIGSGTDWSNISGLAYGALAVKTDGTLWSWGYNGNGQLGHNDTTHYSSPKQVPGTSWPTDRKKLQGVQYTGRAIKTDGTFWIWGRNNFGNLGQNNVTQYSSPVQIPGTNYITVSGCANRSSFALREQS